jgi:hypothetical protein
MTQLEEWRIVQGYNGRYLASNLGRIKSTARCVLRRRKNKDREWISPQTIKEKILKGCNGSGYHIVRLSAEGKEKIFGVHQCVLSAFSERPEWAECINHKDGNKLNNNLSNLEWATLSENSKHAWKNGLYESNKNSQYKAVKIQDKDISRIKHLHSLGVSQREISLIYGVNRSYICSIVNGKYDHRNNKFS